MQLIFIIIVDSWVLSGHTEEVVCFVRSPFPPTNSSPPSDCFFAGELVCFVRSPLPPTNRSPSDCFLAGELVGFVGSLFLSTNTCPRIGPFRFMGEINDFFLLDGHRYSPDAFLLLVIPLSNHLCLRHCRAAILRRGLRASMLLEIKSRHSGVNCTSSLLRVVAEVIAEMVASSVSCRKGEWPVTL